MNGTYDPSKMLDFAVIALKCKNDSGLARLMEVAPATVSKIRHRKYAVSTTILIALHELTGLSTKELRKIAGDRRKLFRHSTRDESPKAEQRLAA